MKKLGATTQETSKEETLYGPTIGRFKEIKEYKHRCLSGPKRREAVTYPTFRRNFETHEIEASYNTIILPPVSTGIRSIFDKLEAIDKKIQESSGIDKKSMYSPLSRSTKFVYIVLSRDLENEGKPWVGPWEYPISVSRTITKLQAEESTKDSSKLRYGPYWTWDVIVEKFEDKNIKSTDKRRTIKYTAQVDPECMPLAGKISKKAVEEADFFDNNPELFEKYLSTAFTPEEIEAINAYSHSLDDIVVPVTSDAEILAILAEFPINLQATDDAGNDVFKFKKQLALEIRSLGQNLLAEHVPAETKQLPVEDSASATSMNTPLVEEPDSQGW